jgi:hypothetical protein
MSEVEEKKEKEFYDKLEHPEAHPDLSLPSDKSEEDVVDEIKDWASDKSTKIALLTGFMSSVITILNAVLG